MDNINKNGVKNLNKYYKYFNILFAILFSCIFLLQLVFIEDTGSFLGGEDFFTIYLLVISFLIWACVTIGFFIFSKVKNKKIAAVLTILTILILRYFNLI